VRVDIRGTGDSDGIIEDEYAPIEQDDALEVIAWIAETPWCTGSVGMIGISWGGFNGLQIAARHMKGRSPVDAEFDFVTRVGVVDQSRTRYADSTVEKDWL